MMRKIDLWFARHPVAQTLLSVLLATAVILLISPGRSPAEVLGRTAALCVTGMAVVLAFRRREQRAARASGGRYAELEQRMRHGEVPEDPADREAMRGLVAQRLRVNRHRHLALAVLWLLMGGVAVAAALTQSTREAVGYGLLAAVFLGWITWYGRRTRRTMLRVARELGVPADGREPEYSAGRR
jgi:hypothetical protein